MKRDYYYELELLDVINYGNFYKEAQEIGLKAWLSGGKVKRNKKTWYAHLHKGKRYGRGYFLSKSEVAKSAEYINNYFYKDKVWHKQKYPLRWLIKHFWPVPTWPEEFLHERQD